MSCNQTGVEIEKEADMLLLFLMSRMPLERRSKRIFLKTEDLRRIYQIYVIDRLVLMESNCYRKSARNYLYSCRVGN